MVRKNPQRPKFDYWMLPKKRSKIGKISGAERDFEREKTLTEPDKDDFREWLQNMTLKDDSFKAAAEEEWQKWTEVPGGWNDTEGEIYWVGQSHLDVAWEWRLPQTIEKSYVTYNKAVFHAETIPDYCFAGSQALTYEFVRQKHPDTFKKMQEMHAKGKFELVGGSWVEPDCRMPSGEAFIRQRLYGQHYFLEYFSNLPKIEWTPDTFGYAWSMPQIIAKSGGNAFFTTKVWGNSVHHPNAPWPFVNFMWEGPDGTQVLTHIQPQMFSPIPAWPGSKPKSRLVKKGEIVRTNYLTNNPQNHPNLASLDEDPNAYVKEMGVFFGLGDGGHGPTGKEVAVVQEWLKKGRGHWSTVHKYFDQLATYKDRLPIWNDELYFQQHHGTLTTQGLVKKMIRRLEWDTTALERLATLVEMLGGPEIPYCDLKQVWLDILTNHFHDIFPGSSIPEVYDDSYDMFVQDLELLDVVKTQTLDYLFGLYSKTITGFEKTPLSFIYVNIEDIALNKIIEIPISENTKNIISGSVVNVDYWLIDRSEVKKLQGTGQIIEADLDIDDELVKRPKRLVLTGNVPANAIIIGSIKESSSISPELDLNIEEDSNQLVVKNGFIQVSVAKSDGAINSFKFQKEELLSGSTQFQAFADFEDVWEIQKNFRDMPMEWEIIEEPKVTESGPVRWVISFLTQFEDAESVFRISYIFYPRLAYFDVEVKVDWQDPGIMIKMLYPLKKEVDVSIAEIPGAEISRLLNPTSIHDKARWENNCQTYVKMPAKDNSIHLAFMNDGKYGYGAFDNSFELTLLRGGRYPKIADEAWCRDERRARVLKGEDVPGSSDRYWHVIKQRVLPYHDSENDLVFHYAHDFNRSPIVNTIGTALPNSPTSPTLESITPTTFSNLITLSSPSLEIIGLKCWEPIIALDNSGYIIRILNQSKEKISAEVRFDSSLLISEIVETDLLERPEIPRTDTSGLYRNYDVIKSDQHISVKADWNPYEFRTFLLS